MDRNSSKMNNIKNPSRPTVLSHSRSISTIPNHPKNISFMPKFFLKTLKKKQQQHHHHKRSVSMASTVNGNSTSYNDLGNVSDERRGKMTRIDKHLLMQFIPISRRVSSIVSVLLKSNKSRDQERQRKDHRPYLAKQLSDKGKSHKSTSNDEKRSKIIESRSSKGRSGRNMLPCNVTSHDSDTRVKVGNVARLTVNGERISRNKSLKGGLKIKGIVKIKREKSEKRFELCKKKILMGEKCRPLNGSLRYDKNGVLVPDGNLAG